MKRRLTALLILYALSFTSAQVGINTNQPKTTFDVSAKPGVTVGSIDNTQVLGLQAPRVTRAQLTASIASYGTDQKGALIYVTDVSGGSATDARVNITSVGYYFFDGSVWQKISLGSAVLPVKIIPKIATATIITNHTQRVYTGQDITIPPGKWMIVLTLGITQVAGSSVVFPGPVTGGGTNLRRNDFNDWIAGITQPTGSNFVRFMLVEGPGTAPVAAVDTTISPDAITPRIASTGFGRTMDQGTLNGFLGVNNTSGSNKTYHLYVDNAAATYAPNFTIQFDWNESYIFYYPINN